MVDEAGDRDGDGFISVLAGGRDCDDADARVYPGASEVCDDNKDNDCDGFVDDIGEGGLAWYQDTDLDGYGADEIVFVACLGWNKPGWSLRPGDCDDTNAARNPGVGDASCDGVDDDCDGNVDEDAQQFTWFVDADGDGYGDPTSPIIACRLPQEASANDDDCDDTNASIAPNMSDDCDGLDNNCNNLIDEDVPEEDFVSWYLDSDGDLFGDPDTEVQACAQPPGHVSGAGDCDDTNASIHVGAPEACDGLDSDCDGEDGQGVSIAATLAGQSFATLDAALSAASPGATVDICPGDWELSTLSVSDVQGLTLRGSSGRGVTTLREASQGIIASVEAGARLTLEGLTLSGSDDAALDVVDGTLVVLDSRISNNGLGIDALGVAGFTVELSDTIVEGNEHAEESGAGIRAVGTGDLVLTSCEISSNVSVGSGGGVYFVGDSNSTLTMTSCVVQDNEAITNLLGFGGGVSVVNVGNVSIVDSTISGNDAFDGGGLFAIWTTGAGSLQLTSSTFTSNTALLSGGLSFFAGDGSTADIVLDNTDVTDNTASIRAGGIGIVGSPSTGSLQLLSSSISNNHALEGGGIYTIGARIEGDVSSEIADNDAGLGGGLVAQDTDLTGLQVMRNAAIDGGGLALTGLPSNLFGVIADANTASGNGGGIYVATRGVVLDSACEVTSNLAILGGGGAYLALFSSLETQGAFWGSGATTNNTPNDILTSFGRSRDLVSESTSCGAFSGCL